MKHHTRLLRSVTLSLSLALLGTVSAGAMDMVTKPETLKWGPAPANLPKGAEIAVLQGDPTKPEHFTIRLKMPSGYAIPAHHHPTMENVTVLSGMLYAGMGDNADKTKAAAFAPGGFASLPAQMNHFAYADTDVVIQVEAEGPFSITYADPANDPSKPH